MALLAALDYSAGPQSTSTPTPSPSPSPMFVNFPSSGGVAPGFQQVSGGVTPGYTNTGLSTGVGPSGTVTQVQSHAYATPVTVVQVSGAPGVVTSTPVTRSVVLRGGSGGFAI